jgi:hypothetical protein
MKTFLNNIFFCKKFLFFSCMLSLGCADKTNDLKPEQNQINNKPSSLEAVPTAIASAKELTSRAYELKREGQNGAALKLFEKAHNILVGAKSHQSAAAASNLDDQATIYMRTGNYSRARDLFKEAISTLKSPSVTDDRLVSGIDRRLSTIAAFEKQGVVCREPLVPNPPEPSQNADSGTNEGLPYFPDKMAMERVFDKITNDLSGCVDKGSRPVAVRMVITGDGRIVVTETRGQLKSTEAGKCLAKQILAVAVKHKGEFPPFAACFRNFTHPFSVN